MQKILQKKVLLGTTNLVLFQVRHKRPLFGGACSSSSVSSRFGASRKSPLFTIGDPSSEYLCRTNVRNTS